jgi:hypothetical protein
MGTTDRSGKREGEQPKVGPQGEVPRGYPCISESSLVTIILLSMILPVFLKKLARLQRLNEAFEKK